MIKLGQSLYYVQKIWPDFGERDLVECVGGGGTILQQMGSMHSVEYMRRPHCPLLCRQLRAEDAKTPIGLKIAVGERRRREEAHRLRILLENYH